MENVKKSERFETAEKLFFDAKPKEDIMGGSGTVIKTGSGVGGMREGTTVVDCDSDGEQGTQNEHLQNLRKMLQRKTKGYHVTTRRKQYHEHGNQNKPFSPIFMKRTYGQRENTKLMDNHNSDGKIGLLPGGGITKRGMRIYASNPALGNYKKVNDAMGQRYSIKNKSMPDRINMVTNHMSGAESFPKNLPKITPKSQPKTNSDGIEPEYPEYRPGKYQDVNYTEYSYDPSDGDYSEEDEEEGGQSEQSSMVNSSAAKAEVEADWLLDEMLKEEMRQFERKSNWLRIKTNDETINGIDQRMEEIKEMLRPRKDPRKVLDRMDPELRDRVLKVKAIPMEEFKRQKRKKWKLRDVFVWSIQMVRFLLKCFWSRKKYYIDKTDMGQLRRKIEKQMKSSQQNNSLTPTSRSSIPAELEISLRNRPRLRSTTNIAQVLWLLRTTKAFKALFPAEMEQELATHVSYEKYDDGRIIAYQSRTPDRFYYVLAGRVSVLRQFTLSTGQVTKHMGYLAKGNLTDPEEMEKQWMREDSLVAKGQVEVLLLEKDAFVHLQTTHKGPPVDFIKTIDLFENFEPEIFLSHPDAIEYKYYGQGKLVVKDSNRTAWLHLVKSGSVKVVRRQSVIDSVASNSQKFSSRNEKELGCEKYSSHAEAMLGVQAKQKKLQELRFSLPQGLDNLNLGNPFANTLGLDAEGEVKEETIPHPPVIYRTSAKTHLQHFQTKTAMEERRKTLADLNNPQLLDSDSEDEITDRKERKRKTSGTKLPVINIPTRLSNATPDNQIDLPNMWLTKERTELQDRRHRKKKQEVSFRNAYLQLDELKAGDVFGLDHLQPALASEPHGHSLVSDGAEVVKISKRFFLQHASNNSMMKVEIMYKQYLSEDEAKDRLYERETWGQYKTALWDRITAPIIPPNSVR